MGSLKIAPFDGLLSFGLVVVNRPFGTLQTDCIAKTKCVALIVFIFDTCA